MRDESKKGNYEMPQHDLKTHQTKQGEEPQLYAWCICGGWTYQSAKLGMAYPLESFMVHLQEIGAYLTHAQKYSVNERGEWAG